MTRFFVPAVMVTLGLQLISAQASAQIFGPRNIGRNTNGATTLSAAGQVEPNRRFVRGQRSAANFVGSDRNEAQAFVGSVQTVNDGNVTSTVAGLREQPTARVNRRRVRRTGGLYAERLAPSFSVPAPDPATPDPITSFSPALMEISQQERIELSRSADGKMVTLKGTVSNDHERRIAELLVMFEPSAKSVKNDLQVAP